MRYGVRVDDVGDQVHVWHGVAAGEPADAEYAVLSGAERERAARFVRPGDRVRFVAAHAGTRRVLARYLGTDPAAIRFATTPCCKCGSTDHGRPRIDWPPTTLSYNLSHSGEHWLLAAAAGRAVGVDIECFRDVELGRMAQACLSAAERAYLDRQPESERQEVFFRSWTRKEAVLKACGVGLAARLTSLEVRPEQRGPVEVRHSSGTCPDAWLVEDLPAGSGWSAAVAQPAAQAGPVVFRSFEAP
jgi:4'-phosphopantetheinyl transferase